MLSHLRPRRLLVGPREAHVNHMKTLMTMTVFGLLLATAAVATASAWTDNAGTPNHTVTIPFGGTYYIICGPPPEVWKESNGTPGLQQSPSTDPRGHVIPADTPLLILENDLAGYLISLYCKML